MKMVDLIRKKKSGEKLTKEEIGFAVAGYTAGKIPDYQMSALLMAICFRGMDGEEVAWLTEAMLHSGESLDLSAIPGVKVDKHSTGGVGDTTTLILAPLVAACGVPVAKLSGRGLGHTGGTLDKLESVPGLSVSMDAGRFVEAVKRNGIALMGQSETMVPADKKMYALRDVTATVDSIPLIASSIMSKKLASGSDAIVLDVKTGNGAFMASQEKAEELAWTMVNLGRSMGKRVAALVTDMNQPLGSAIGNAIELREAILALKGKLPANCPLMEVTWALGEEMLLLSGAAKEESQARSLLQTAWKTGKGLEKLRLLIEELGGDSRCCEEEDLLLRAERTVEVRSERAGFVTAMETAKLGRAAMALGAGRSKMDEPVDPDVGVMMHVRLGDPVEAGGLLARLYVNGEKGLNEAEALVKEAVTVGETPPKELRHPVLARIK